MKSINSSIGMFVEGVTIYIVTSSTVLENDTLFSINGFACSS